MQLKIECHCFLRSDIYASWSHPLVSLAHEASRASAAYALRPRHESARKTGKNLPEFFEDGGEKENLRQIRSTADAMRTTSAATVLLCLVVLLFQLAVAWDDFDDKFRLDKKVVDDSNIFGSDFEWWKRQEDIKIKRSDKEEHLPYPLIDFDSSKIKHCNSYNCQHNVPRYSASSELHFALFSPAYREDMLGQ